MCGLASVHFGQHMSFPLVALASAAVLGRFRSALERRQTPDTITGWFQERAATGEPTQALELTFQSFQDDLLQIAVGHNAETIIDEVERRTLQKAL